MDFLNIKAHEQRPIIIVGMARSGTTLVSHVIGSLPGVKIEVEPHALWRSGNFKYYNDEEYDINDRIVHNIRNKLTNNLNGRLLVEKSPINSLRPYLVHAVFPDAKIVYIERDPVRCIYSNYSRSLKKDSFKLSIILKKYFVYTGSKDLSGAISNRKLLQQISMADISDFIKYTGKMFYLRRVDLLPFGPKIKNFPTIIKEKGLLAYHVEVFKASAQYKQKYKELYGDKMETFKMENIMTDIQEMRRIVGFIQVPFTEEWALKIFDSFNRERVQLATKERDIDQEIKKLVEECNAGTYLD